MSSIVFNKRRILVLFFVISLSLLLVYICFVPDKPNHDISAREYPQVFCLISSRTKSINSRNVIRKMNWVSKCDNFYVFELTTNSMQNIDKETFEPIESDSNWTKQELVQLNDFYIKNTKLTFNAFSHVYKQFPKYDWYLKADESTYIFMKNLKEFLFNKSSNEPVTYGYDLKGLNLVYHSGRAGYVLSNEALTRLGKQLANSCENTANEDVDIIKCLRKTGVYSKASIDDQNRERFHPLNISTHIKGLAPKWWEQNGLNPILKDRYCCSEKSISFGYITTNEMNKLTILYDAYLSTFDNEGYLIRFTTILYQMVYT